MKLNTNSFIVLTLLMTAISSGIFYYAKHDLASKEQLGQQKIVSNSNSDTANVALPPAPNAQVMNELLTTIAELKQEINALKTKTTVNEKRTIQQVTQVKPRISVEEQLKQQQEQELETFQKVNDNFRQQQIDTAWSSDATARLEAAVNENKAKGLNIDAIECRATMCKLEMDEMDNKSKEVFRNDFRQQIADVFNAGIVGEDETGRTIIYIAKNSEDIYEN